MKILSSILGLLCITPVVFANEADGKTQNKLPNAHSAQQPIYNQNSDSNLGFKQIPALLTSISSISKPEVSVFLGGSYVPNTINGQTLELLPYETGENADTFTNQSNGTSFTWGLGAKYRFMLDKTPIQNYFFSSIGVGLNAFQIIDFNQTGNVLQFNLPEFENYTYALKLQNNRIMADFDLDFQPIKRYFIPFFEGGIGAARTVVSYSSTPIYPVIDPIFTLPNQASWNFAYQVGAGVKYAAKTHLVFSLGYLYANMGKVNSSILGDTTTLATPLTITMNTHNFLCGLTYVVE